jgi:hypothetical protein
MYQTEADDLMEDAIKAMSQAIAELLKCYFCEKRSFNATKSELATKHNDLLLSLQKYLGNTDAKLICITAHVLDSAMDHLDKSDKSITTYCLEALLNQKINTREIMVAGFSQHGNDASKSQVSASVFKFVARIFGARADDDSQGKNLEAGIIPIVQAFSNQSPLHQKSCIPLLTAILEPLGQEVTTANEVAEAQISHFVRKKQVAENYRYATAVGSLLFGLPVQKFWSERIEEEFLVRFVLLQKRRHEQRAEKVVSRGSKTKGPAEIAHEKWHAFASEIMTRKLHKEFAQVLKQRFDTAVADLDRSTRATLSPRQRIFQQVFTLIPHNKVGYKGLGTTKSNYHPGTISQIRSNAYDITYDHGAHEINVSAENVRSRRRAIFGHGRRVEQFKVGDKIEANADVHVHLAGAIKSCEAWVTDAAFLVKQKAFLHLLRATQRLSSLTNKDADVPLSKGVLGLNNSLPKLFEHVGYKQLSACESINIDNWQLKPSHLKKEKKIETLVSGVLTVGSRAQVEQEWQKAKSKCPCEKKNAPCTCVHQQLRVLTQLRHLVKLVPGVPEESSSQEESTYYSPQDNGDGELCTREATRNTQFSPQFALNRTNRTC